MPRRPLGFWKERRHEPLDRHLREVIVQITSTGGIDLCAIGIRHDVSACYKVSRQVDQIPDLADAVVGLLDRYLVSSGR
ncbi:MAG: hypothetical protein HRU30_09800 [Rhodobacteraceae bacterium]|nr:hypothetical protein [Paracoccaceae bacterium]